MKIYSKIKELYDEMSKSHKRLSDFIINNKNVVPFLTITELSKECNVSTSTLTRYSKKLGFKGYIDFQKALKEELTTELVSFEELRKVGKYTKNEKDVFEKIINSNISALEEFKNQKNEILINEVVEMMLKSKKIFIIGSRSSLSAAYYLYFLLKSLREDTFFIDNQNDGFIKEIQYVDNDDLLIAISYSKYSRFTYKVSEYFKLRHSKVISITDSLEAPICNFSDKNLIIDNGKDSFSFVATMTAVNIIVALYNKKLDFGDKLYEVQDLVSTIFDVYM